MSASFPFNVHREKGKFNPKAADKRIESSGFISQETGLPQWLVQSERDAGPVGASDELLQSFTVPTLGEINFLIDVSALLGPDRQPALAPDEIRKETLDDLERARELSTCQLGLFNYTVKPKRQIENFRGGAHKSQLRLMLSYQRLVHEAQAEEAKVFVGEETLWKLFNPSADNSFFSQDSVTINLILKHQMGLILKPFKEHMLTPTGPSRAAVVRAGVT